MDAGGLSHMSYNQYSNQGFVPNNGFASRGKAGNSKRLSLALPPRVGSISESQADLPTPRTTSRSHLLAGLRTAPKNTNQPASAPYNQQRHQFSNNIQWAGGNYDAYNQGVPHTAMGNNFSANQYAMQAAQQTYALPEQVLAPPALVEEADDMDPNMLEQLQLTGLYLAQRQQQLQQQLANITAAANQFQGLDLGMYQQHMSTNNLVQQVSEPIAVPGQPGLFVVQNPATGEYQYVQLNTQQPPAPVMASLGRSQTMHNLHGPSTFEPQKPVFRAEISPPPADRPALNNTRSITPPTKSKSPQSALEHVEPLPPPSANAFRRGHRKDVSSLSLANGNAVSDGPKTASAATFGSTRVFIPPTPMTGTFGPGAARAGAHPVRQPRGPPPLDELVALPTANHEGSKNFASRRRRAALNNLVRAGSVRRGVSNPLSTTSPTSDGGMSLTTSDEDEPGYYRRQSPIGSERSTKRGSQSSVDGSASGSAVQTPATEDINAFDMQSFVKQLPVQVQQGQERRKMMIGVLSAAEKRKSSMW